VRPLVTGLQDGQLAGNYYLYVVDHVRSRPQIAMRTTHGGLLTAILDLTPPKISYWAALRAGEYDSLDPS
jgi:hypothetical protein